jgi:arachidonate 15-lipoxygenase
MASRRQLSASHPLSVLLAPHFEGTLAINNQAWKKLLSDGGGVDLILAGEISESRKVAVKAALEWSFDDAMFPKELARRGVDDPAALPSYPYRDDGRLLWDAIHAWVESYLRLYYASSADVQADVELQAWVAEIIAPRPHGGQIKGMGEGGRIKTLEYLIDAVTHIVFTASAQHAAVNFPQYNLMSYAPKMPLALFEPPPRDLAVKESDYLRALPPLNLAYAQCALGFLLGTVRYTKLGQYDHPGRLQQLADSVSHPHSYFKDPRGAEPLAAFQKRLADIEETKIVPSARLNGYDYLVPSNVPQSINI